MGELVAPKSKGRVSSPLDRYLTEQALRVPTLLSRFDDSLIEVASNTRKAYNTDVWTALVTKFFRDWDFTRKYDEIASELVRLEALRRLSLPVSQSKSIQCTSDDPLRGALLALSPQPTTQEGAPDHASGVQASTLSEVRPIRISLRGSFISDRSATYLDRVCINASDKQILHHLFSRFEGLFDVEFWNHFFSLDSLGRVFREQEASGNGPATLARKMASLRRFEEFLCHSGLLTMPNLFRQRRPRVTPTAQIVLQGSELKQIARYLDRAVHRKANVMTDCAHLLLLRDRAMFSILDQYLIRASALCNLGMRDIDLRRGTMRVTEKGRKEQVYPLVGDARSCLKEFLDSRRSFLETYVPTAGHEHFVFHTIRGKVMNPRSLSRIINQRAEQAGVSAQIGSRSSIGAHVIRRSGGARYIKSGARIEAISQVMNHASIATTWRYVKGAEIDLSKEVFKRR